ncbi:MAG: hypothetical protein ACO1OB_20470, partial [Archangium sp.]
MERWLSPKTGLLLVTALSLLAFPYHPKLRSPNELCRLWQSRALVDFGTLSINGVMQQRGGVGDLSCTATIRDGEGTKLLPCVGPDAPRVPVLARHYYPSKAPLLSFAAAPVYWVLTKVQGGQVSELSQVFWSRLFITVIPALLFLIMLRRFLEAYVSPATAGLFTVIYALGTMAFTYSETFMSHQVTAVLLFSTFFCAWRVERGEWRLRGYALAGVAAGAAVVSEYTASLGVVCIAAYTIAARWKRWPELAKAVGLVVAGSAPLLALLCWYHAETFGSPFASGYKFLNDAGYMHWHQGGFLGIRVPIAAAFFHSYFSPLRGLFALSPVLAAAFFGFNVVREKDRTVFIFLVVLVAAHTYFTSSFDHTSWGWTVGPRHLVSMVPFLFLPLAMLWEQSSPARQAVIAGLGLTSLLAASLVGLVAYVPDDVSTSVWSLAMPLLGDGFLPVSWLAAWVPNPASGALLLMLIATLAAWLLVIFW